MDSPFPACATPVPLAGRPRRPAGIRDPDPAPIPFFSQRDTFARLWPDIRAHCCEVLDHGKYSHGRKVAELESALAAWTGARHVVGVNSGTDALVLLLRAAGLQPGDEVVVPAFSFVASASAVVLARGRPVFADIEPDTYAVDPASAAAAVTARTRALMPVHLFCQMAEMDALGALAESRGLTLVEDSAEAIGMRWNGTHAGLLGAGGVLSFFPAKTLGAIGDAGAVLTDDPDLARTAAALRHHGRRGHTLDHFPGIAAPTSLPGLNSKMDDLQAAVLLAKLAHLDTAIRRRAELAAAYTELLHDMPGVVRLPAVAPRSAATEPVHYVYLAEFEDRDALADHLARHGVGTEVYYPRPLHLQPCFADLGHGPGDFPNAEAACARALALPLHPDLTPAEIHRVCALIGRFYTGRKPA
ncbi:DegT/DnrJ/EryC1/StrS family aminotransferase [Streptomonospora litoralis]|uniref:UDP-2-acetamido-2-deoxy-3-oxo-D-glucuronate aminotransferase n=1 Tax=Streptomonospora litoralis TaxID=2498135 RepID=A0A4P6Q5H6_9ACTN|nr:DegT/DnrJ/EryC1/StrS family aminotransferase [Streptomonospora litoralis]QBI55530.1 UDP-2-acetamido-2-deoxy-3-oxo-D-glucuronate aminotransferase [Streptomonospora litoralis]